MRSKRAFAFSTKKTPRPSLKNEKETPGKSKAAGARYESRGCITSEKDDL